MKSIISALFIFLLFISPAANASSNNIDTRELKKYTEDLIDDGHVIFNNKTYSDAKRRQEFGALIRSHLYLSWMAKYSLGRHRRTMSKEKISEFIEIYEQFVVKAYADLSSSYSGEKAMLKNIKQIDEDMFIVNIEVLRPGAQLPIKIDYLVHKIESNSEDPYRISDIITEGVSILNSQQAEFNSVISSRGIDALITDLKTRAIKDKKIN